MTSDTGLRQTAIGKYNVIVPPSGIKKMHGATENEI